MEVKISCAVSNRLQNPQMTSIKSNVFSWICIKRFIITWKSSFSLHIQYNKNKKTYFGTIERRTYRMRLLWFETVLKMFEYYNLETIKVGITWHLAELNTLGWKFRQLLIAFIEPMWIKLKIVLK